MLTRRRFILATTAAWTVALIPGIGWGALRPLPGGGLDPLLGPGTKVDITPGTAWREKETSFEIRITLGAEGLPVNDSIGIVNGSYIDRWKFGFPSHWWGHESPWQAGDAGRPGYVSVSCSRKDAGVRLAVGESGGKKPFCNQPSHFVRSLKERMRYVLEISAEKDLKEGDVLAIRWNRVKAPAFATRYFFLPFRYSRLPERDRDLPIRRGEFDLLPAIRVRGHGARRLHVFCRPLVGAGESFDLGLAAVDEYGNPAEDFEGEVRLSCPGKGVVLPERIVFTGEDRGAKRVRGIRAAEPGWIRIDAVAGDVSGRSNYVVVSKEKPAQRLYFGDMHAHTIDCDGTIDVRGHFEYGPRIAGLDFGAVSPHAEYFGCREAWRRYIDETTKANRPGEFVAFYGYEWANEGHTNAYFLTPEEAVLIYGARMIRLGHAPDDPEFRMPCAHEGEFLHMLRALDRSVFCIAHCHTRYGKKVDDSVLWLDEIYSCHKHDRDRREERLRRNLARGLKLGVVAGSDMHRLTMGHLCRLPGERWPQGGWEKCQWETAGLQGTFAPELTRRGLYEGMKARRTYGTSGARIVLLFSCGGHPMGSTVALHAEASPEFRVQAGGTAPISEVAICRFDGEAWSEPWKKRIEGVDRVSEMWRDDDFTGTGIYYVRLKQSDGERAWSSPIWVGRETP